MTRKGCSLIGELMKKKYFALCGVSLPVSGPDYSLVTGISSGIRLAKHSVLDYFGPSVRPG